MNSGFQSHRIADRSTNASSVNFSIGASTQPLHQQATHNDDFPGILSTVGSAAFVGIVAVAMIMIAFLGAQGNMTMQQCCTPSASSRFQEMLPADYEDLQQQRDALKPHNMLGIHDMNWYGTCTEEGTPGSNVDACGVRRKSCS